MKSRIFLALLLFASLKGMYAQIDSCDISPVIQANYLDDAYVLVGREMVNPLHPYYDSIDIPWVLLERPLKSLSIVYNMSCPEWDTVFILDPAHVWGATLNVQGSFLMQADTSYEWVQQLIIDSTFSGNPVFDSLVPTRGFKMTHYLSSIQYIIMRSPHRFNLPALVSQLIAIPGVISASPDGLMGDGGDIKLYQSEKSDSIVFSYGWGDCMSGCIYHRYFIFQADTNCIGSFLYAYGTPFPVPVSVTEQQGSVSLFPNPFSGIIELSLPGSQVSWVEVYSLAGAFITQCCPEGNKCNLSGLRDGAYLLRVIDAKGKALARKIVLKQTD